MLNSQKVREEIASLQARVVAITKVCESEGRDFSPEEQAEVDVINGVGGGNGKIGELKEKLVRIEKIEAVQADLAKTQMVAQQPTAPTAAASTSTLDRFTVPAQAKKRGSLQCFAGPDAEKEAFIAGQFYAATLFGNVNAKQWLTDHGMSPQAAMSGSDNTKGGYLVPTLLDSNIIRLVSEYGVARQNCQVYPMPGSTVIVPRRKTGFTAYWVGENSSITASDLAFDQIRLDAKKLAVLTQVSRELGEDSAVALGDLLTKEFALILAYNEDAACFNGDGTSTYGGIVGLKSAVAAGSKSTSTGGVDTWAELTITDFLNAKAKIARIPGLNPKWYIHPSGFDLAMHRLALAAGGNTAMNYADPMQVRFLGAPVVFTNVLPDITSATSGAFFCYYGDLSMAVTLGDRRGIEVASDASIYFASDALAVRCTERLDINVHERGDATTAGPVIAMVAG